MWTSEVIPYRTPVDGASYVETADSGGYDECFPTVGACNIPSIVPRYGGLALPDHGELWSQPATCVVETRADGTYATTSWAGRRLPYRFERAVVLAENRGLTMRYAVTNDGRERMPFLWSAHPLLPVTPETEIELPEGATMRVYAQHRIDLGAGGTQLRWPRVPAGKKVLDLSRPHSVARSYACKIFLSMPEGRAAVREGDARLEVAFESRDVPNFGLWINKHGWAPRGRRRGAYLNLAFEPCIGAPDTLSDALAAWDSAHWLEPGETRRWELTWTGTSALPSNRD